MNTEVDLLTPTQPGEPGRAPSTNGGPRRRSTRPILIAIAAVAVAIGGIVIAVAAFAGDDDPDPAPAAAADDGETLELTLGADDPLASCLAFDVVTLSGMSPAFAGTATAVTDDTVTLSVDRWYAGGTEPTVVLETTPGMEALIGGIAFDVGQQYLITAADGTVNFCGYSGVATPEMTAAFDEAFGG